MSILTILCTERLAALRSVIPRQPTGSLPFLRPQPSDASIQLLGFALLGRPAVECWGQLVLPLVFDARVFGIDYVGLDILAHCVACRGQGERIRPGKTPSGPSLRWTTPHQRGHFFLSTIALFSGHLLPRSRRHGFFRRRGLARCCRRTGGHQHIRRDISSRVRSFQQIQITSLS